MATIKLSAKDVVENGGNACMGVKVFYDEKHLSKCIDVHEEGDRLILEFNIKRMNPPKDYEVEYEV